MGFFVRAVSRRNIIAIVVGALLAGVPLIAFNFWLDSLIDRQGEAEVEHRRQARHRACRGPRQDAVGALDDLAARGVNSCEPGQIEAMRLCRIQHDSCQGNRRSSAPTERRCAPISACRSASGRCSPPSRWSALTGYSVRHHCSCRAASAWCDCGARSALVPTALPLWCRRRCSLPQVSTQGGPFSGYARIVTRAGRDHRGGRRATARRTTAQILRPTSDRTNSALMSKS